MIIDAFKKGVKTLNARGVDLDFMIIIHTSGITRSALHIYIPACFHGDVNELFH